MNMETSFRHEYLRGISTCLWKHTVPWRAAKLPSAYKVSEDRQQWLGAFCPPSITKQTPSRVLETIIARKPHLQHSLLRTHVLYVAMMLTVRQGWSCRLYLGYMTTSPHRAIWSRPLIHHRWTENIIVIPQEYRVDK